MIYSRVRGYFDDSWLLSNNQFGYRKNKNTELAITTLIKRVLPALENKSFAICVFLDFSACFDTSHDMLLNKLYSYGITGVGLILIRAYLRNWKQYVRYNVSNSTVRGQNLGTIQGSKCGPLFCDIYSNDRNFLCSSDEDILLADDTCLVYTGESLELLVNHVNERLSLIYDWCCFNKLSINPSKSE